MRAPVRPIRGRWPGWLELRTPRYFRADPRDILDESVEPEVFRQAMSALNVGDTIKITGANRHPDADALVVEYLHAHEVTDATIVDIGASDGSTSLDLIQRIGSFGAYVIADLFLTLEVVQVGRRTLFFQGDGSCVLVVGPRIVAWPNESQLLMRLFSRLVGKARRQSSGRQSVLLLNPSVQRHIAADPRVSYRVHDVFEPWSGPTPDIIKVANLLRRLYFDDARIVTALRALLSSLEDGGHLFVVDNPRMKNTPPRGGLYRRSGDRFVQVAQTVGTPEIDDLIRAVTLEPASGQPPG